MRRIILIILILINIVYVGSGAVKFGAQSIDVYANWLFKAKALYVYRGRIPEEIWENFDYRSAHWQYPPLWPAAVWQIYELWGFDEQVIYLIFPVIYALVLLLAYANLRKTGLSQINSLGLTYVYSMMGPLLAQGGRYHPGNADILITLLGWLIVYFRRNKLLVAVLVMTASLTKTEGVFWVAFLFKSCWLIAGIFPALVWQWWIRRAGIGSDFGLTVNFDISRRIWELFRGVFEELVNFRNWYILWPVFFLVAVKHGLWKPLLIMLIGFSLVYLSTNIETYAYVHSSFDRVLLQVSPVWLTILGYGFGRRYRKIGRSE